MIELPEAVTVAAQIAKELAGVKIKAGDRGNSPHKFAFVSFSPEEYASLLPGKTVGQAYAQGSAIMIPLDPGYRLVLGVGGERILLHRDATTLPAKRQLLLEFEDGRFLTVSVQGWGSTLLLDEGSLGNWEWVLDGRLSPLDPGFTEAHFLGLFDELKVDDARAAKFFLISKPGVIGVGNGTTQDILFEAEIHPRRRAAALSIPERKALYASTVRVIREAVGCGGRDSERDLYGEPGGYRRILHSKSVGEPCPRCGTPIEKIQFLGGASYFCPSCQKLG